MTDAEWPIDAENDAINLIMTIDVDKYFNVFPDTKTLRVKINGECLNLTKEQLYNLFNTVKKI